MRDTSRGPMFHERVLADEPTPVGDGAATGSGPLRRAERHEEVLRLAAAALGGANLNEVLTRGTRLVAAALNVDRCHVLRVFPGGTTVDWADAAATSEAAEFEAPTEGVLRVEPASVVGSALAAVGPVVVPDPRADVGGRPDSRPRRPGFGRAITVALRVGTETVGVLAAVNATPRTFGPEDGELLEAVAAVLTGAVIRHRTTTTLGWRSRIDQALTVASTKLIGLGADELGAGIRATIGAIGALLGADHACVYLTRDGATWTNTAEWSAENPPAGCMRILRSPDAAQLLSRLRQGEAVCRRGPVNAPVETDPDWAFLAGRDVRSVVALPMLADGQLIGFTGFGLVGAGRAWPAELGTLLRPVGAMLANAVARQRTTAELAASELRFRSLVDEIRDVIVRLDAAGSIQFVNRAWTELTGNSLEETVGRGPLDYVHPDDHALVADHLRATAAGENVGPREVRFLTRDGGVRWMEVKGRPVVDATGAVTGFTGMVVDVTERREVEKRVQAALALAEQTRDVAERASQAKSQFLSRMSHELRTPLNAILGFGQLLEFSDLEAEDAENLEQILRAGRHLLDLINEALDITRIESGHLALSLEPVRLAEVVEEASDLLRPAAATRSVTLRVVTPRSAQVVADRHRLKQVLVNLLSNGVKYNHDGGVVVVDCQPSPPGAVGLADPPAGWLRITVTDTGIGIPPERLDDVFTPFERLGAELTEVEGTGVGLTLTKSLVEAMGGRIGVRSTPGDGSSFDVDLPAAVTDLAESNPDSDPAGEVPEEALEATEYTHTVLYVEDNPSNVTLVRRVLARRPQVRLLVARDGASGQEMLRRHRPDVLLLDLHLPTLDGAQVLAALRSEGDPRLRAIPAVMVTADLTPGTERRLLDAGATAFLSKPLDIRELLETVDQQLSAG